ARSGRLCGRAAPARRGRPARRHAPARGDQRRPAADLRARREGARRGARARLERRPLRAPGGALVPDLAARGAQVSEHRRAARADRGGRGRGAAAARRAMTAATEARAAAPSRMRDPRVWLGLAVALLAVWLALRGVDLRGVWQEFERARWGVLLGISVPAYLAVVWLRALRWRHLTDAIQPMPRPALFRAVA